MTYPGATRGQVTASLRPPWISSKFCVLLQPARSRGSYPQVSSAHPGGVSLGIKHLARHDSEPGSRQPSRWVGYQVDCGLVGILFLVDRTSRSSFRFRRGCLWPVCRLPACHAVACRRPCTHACEGGPNLRLTCACAEHPGSSPLSCSSARMQERRARSLSNPTALRSVVPVIEKHLSYMPLTHWCVKRCSSSPSAQSLGRANVQRCVALQPSWWLALVANRVPMLQIQLFLRIPGAP